MKNLLISSINMKGSATTFEIKFPITRLKKRVLKKYPRSRLKK